MKYRNIFMLTYLVRRKCFFTVNHLKYGEVAIVYITAEGLHWMFVWKKFFWKKYQNFMLKQFTKKKKFQNFMSKSQL